MKKALIILLAVGVMVVWVRAQEPEHISVQHVLIAFQGSIPDAKVTRTKTEAEALAKQVFDRAKKGEDFDALVKQFTDDEYPGIYGMSNFNAAPDASKKEYSRAKMVKSFGDVGFSLPVGGIGLAVYDSKDSKYGWHIIKRLK